MTNINHVFWGEIEQKDHFLQVYESDDVLIDSLEAYVCAGIVKGDGVVIVATEAHLISLNERLERVFNVKKLMADKQFIPLNADIILEMILVHDTIDEQKFMLLINDILSMVRQNKENRIRVYGELVAILWRQGNRNAVLTLEKLWDKLCKTGAISLFCAYPKDGFSQDEINSIQEICHCHNCVIENDVYSPELNIYGEKLMLQAI